ncbi:MAG TPA: TrkA C-terminal domain-containing protein [Acidimicrobiales bacterium]|nr:TrkA C-terminal domain-containing protein [Acidimicrobiales bacterium]
MAAVISLLAVVLLSLVVTRVATVALTLTGLARESARFQARSAFTGVGFTTAESESVVKHPVRRRIIMLLILLGNAGIVTGVASLLLGFTHVGGAANGAERAGVLVGGLVLLVFLTRSRLIDRWMSRVIERALRRFTSIEVRDFAGLLRLSGDWMVVEMEIDENDWIADRPLSELDLPDEGVVVLGIIHQNGRYLGAPKGAAVLHAGDVAVLYGRRSTLADLDERRRDAAGLRDRLENEVEHRAILAEDEAAETVHP